MRGSDMEGRGERGAPGEGLELLTAVEMGHADQAAVKAGVPSLELMESAGRAVAELARKLVPPGSRVLVLCGPGNNGGDGFVAARHLKRASYDVRLHLLGDKAALKGDAAEMARRWDGPVRAMDPDAVESMHLVIDAMFGAGLSRPLDGVAASVVEAVNALGMPVIAVDVPSGLDGSTGVALGPVIQATHTVTFFRRKPGHLLMPGRALCGLTSVADIGIPAAVLGDIRPQTWANAPGLWLHCFPRPATGTHKYERGHAVVVSGPAEATGAARLGARGALRIGAGLVTVVGSSAATAVNAVHLTAIMVHSVGRDTALAEFLADTRRNAVLIGPGAGVATATTDTVRTVLASPAAAVLDADALTAFALADKQGPEGVGFGFTNVRDRSGARREDLFEAIAKRRGARRHHAARGGVQAPVPVARGRKARACARSGAHERRRRHTQGAGHGDRRARRSRRDQRECAALSRDGRIGRCARRICDRPPRADACRRSRPRARPCGCTASVPGASARASSPRTCRNASPSVSMISSTLPGSESDQA